VRRFLDLLTSQAGHHATFGKLDNLCEAFLFATAIKDQNFQQLAIKRIYYHVINCFETGNSSVLYGKLVQKVAWAWYKQTEGREGLQPVLTMLLAWICTSPEKLNVRKKKKKKGEAEGMLAPC
jgi:thymidylate kinase